MKRVIATTVAVIGLSFGLQAHAVLIDITGASDSFTWFGNDLGCDSGCNLGYSFALADSVTIDGLGIFDDLADGLDNSHHVGIWDSAGSLLASTTVLAGTVGTDPSASGLGGYAYASIGDLSLSAGTYIVSALFEVGHTDRVLFEATGMFGTAGGATFGTSLFSNTGVFGEPDGLATGRSYFGPAIRVATASVPEPTSLSLLGAALLALGFFRRKLA